MGSKSASSWCYTASYKPNEMGIRQAKAFRRWHVKNSRVWQEVYLPDTREDVKPGINKTIILFCS